MKLELDINEVLRYMGHGGNDSIIVETAQAAIDSLLNVVQPRYHYVRLPLSAMELPGLDIRRHLAGCDGMYLMCATLGAAVDREIRRAERSSMLRALALDAAAGDAVEKLCDAAQDKIFQKETADGRYITGRFSPGYGDLPLTVQPDLLRLCDAPRKIGLSLTQSGILVPRKSVTAILGTSSVPVEGKKRGCGSCSMTADCPFRKKGITCGS